MKKPATAALLTVLFDLIKATVETMATAPNPIRHMGLLLKDDLSSSKTVLTVYKLKLFGRQY